MESMSIQDTVAAQLLALLQSAMPIDPAAVLLQLKKEIIHLRQDFRGYMNVRVMSTWDGAVPGGLHHVRFIPSESTGHVLIVPCAEGDEGAVAVKRSGRGGTATLPLRAPLVGFDLVFPNGRGLPLPFTLLPTGLQKPTVVGVVTVQRKAPRKQSSRRSKKPAVTA